MIKAKNKLRHRIYRILEPDGKYNVYSRTLSRVLMITIIVNVVAVMLESVASLEDSYRTLFLEIEIFSAIIFTFEYFFRVWSCVEDPRYKARILGRIKFMATPLLIVDLIAIGPFYLQLIYPLSQEMVTAWLVMRVFRLLKVTRYIDSLRIILDAVKVERDAVLATLSGGMILLVVFSSLMFLAEHEAQPEAFGSIPAAMWYGIATLTTLGYGDVIPITTIGKIIGGCMAILGVGMFVLPAGILAAGFEEQLHKRRNKPKPCPHCGKNIYAPPKMEVDRRRSEE